jgi:DNA-binding transcriptional regulator GbsR (MarR family)
LSNVVFGDGDFFVCQNYLLDLMRQKKISTTDLSLYAFLKSISGFPKIECSYQYYHLNTGISIGAISASFQHLEENNLVTRQFRGNRKTFIVDLVPDNHLPRRILEKIDYTDIEKPQIKENFAAQQKATNSVFMANLSEDGQRFWNTWKDYWAKMNDTNYYLKNDSYELQNISDYSEAIKLIPVLWVLAEDNTPTGRWIRNGDYSLSVFRHVYAKLLARYPRTSFFKK